jgi:uncharacterized protein YbbK (DUF523 family)
MSKLIAVSACLLGVNCKYNGGHNLKPEVIDYLRGKEILPICPEVFGGLGTPRIPSEIQADGRIINEVGDDVTTQFENGKDKTIELLRKHQVKQVILKDGSPSCGYRFIYDGRFKHHRIQGEGIIAKALREAGFDIIDLKT